MLATKGGMTLSDINEQPNHWQNAIKIYNKEKETLVWIKKVQFNQVIFMGEGASYYAAMMASGMFNNIGKIPSMAFHSSDIFINENLPFHPKLKTLLIAISRSGNTDETIWAVEYIKKMKPDTQIFLVTCNADSPMKSLCQRTLVLTGCNQEIVLPISSFSTTIYLLGLIAGAIGGNAEFLGVLSKLPKTLDIKKFHDMVSKMRRLQDFKGMFFGGAGYNLGLAAYSSLLLKAMSMTPSEYFNTFEFRHNNFLNMNNTYLATFILSERTKSQEIESMREAAKLRAQILLIAEDIDEKIEAGVEYAVKLKTGDSLFTRAFHIIPYVQLLAFQHTFAKGFNPDKPKNIIDIVKYKNKPECIA